MQQNHIKAIGIVHATMENKTEVLSYKEQENEKDQQERPWSDLPQDLLSLIMANLFVGDCIAFNMACKSWRPITPAIRPLPPPIGSPHCQSPCLMLFQRSNHNFKMFHPLYNDFYHMELPEIVDAKIRFSKYGWLLMSREDLSVFFFNPSTKVTIELPKMPSLDGFATMCFTSPPTSLDCSVVGFCSFPNIEIGIIRRGEGSWTTHEFIKTQNFYFSDCNPIFYRRMFYCLGVNGNVGIFDPRDNACSWTIPVKCLTHCGPDLPDAIGLPQQSFLVKIGGVISAVLVADEERRVSVYRLDQTRKVWRTLHTLGDKTLYVSRCASFAETATVKGMANRIYFPKFHGMNGVFYSLATRKFHSLDGDFSSSMSYGLKHIQFSTWFKPTFESQCNEELEW